MSENALSTVAVRRFAQCEAAIASGLKTFAEVGKALLEINDQRYYRIDYPNFDAYLKSRWGISKSRGYQLMQAAALSTDVDVDNEAQARELVGLEVDEAKEVVEETKRRNNGKVTAPALRQTRERKNAQRPPTSGSSESGGASSSPQGSNAAGQDVDTQVPPPASSPAPNAAPIDTTAREVDGPDTPCPFCKGTGLAFAPNSTALDPVAS